MVQPVPATLNRSLSGRTTRAQTLTGNAVAPLYQALIEGTNQAEAQTVFAAQAAGLDMPGSTSVDIPDFPIPPQIPADPLTPPPPARTMEIWYTCGPPPAAAMYFDLTDQQRSGLVDSQYTRYPDQVFTDERQALEALQSTRNSLPTLCQGASIPPPTDTPPAVPPADDGPAADYNDNWQYVVYARCAPSPAMTRLLRPTLAQHLGMFAAGWVQATGVLFGTEGAADRWIADQFPIWRNNCVTQPQPPSQPQPPTIPGAPPPSQPPVYYDPATGTTTFFPLFQCPAPPFEGGLPCPGSKEWCAGVGSILQWFVEIGDTVWIWIDTYIDPNNWMRWAESLPGEFSLTNPLSNFGAALREVVKLAIKLIGPGVQTLRETIKCLKQWLLGIAPPGAANALVALKAVQGVIRLIRDIQLGTDAGVWLVSFVRIELDGIERHIAALEEYLWPTALPNETVAHQAWLRNYITSDHYRCILRAHGQCYEPEGPFGYAHSEKITTHEAIRLARRLATFQHDAKEAQAQAVSEAALEASGAADMERSFLRGLGWVDEAQREAVRKSYWEIPGIADHLHFLRKRVDDPHVVDRFQLMTGFEDTFWPKFGPDLTTLGLRKDYAGLHYAAHWSPPNPGQLAEMVFRLREGRVNAGLVTTEEDYRQAMGEQALGHFWRDRMLAIQHPAPNLTLCLRMLMNGLLDRDQFIEALMDLGYSRGDADRIAQTYIFESRRMRASSSRGWTPGSLLSAYVQGKVDKVFVADRMAFLGYSTDEINAAIERAPIDYQLLIRTKVKSRVIARAVNTIADAYKCGSITRQQFLDNLTGLGLDLSTAEAYAQQIDSSISVELCKQNIAAVRKAYLGGKINLVQTRERLAAMGIPGQRIEQYLYSWEIQKEANSPIPTAAKLLQWVASGYMDGATAALRLRNLGWSDPDATIMLAEAQGRLNQREAKQLAAATRTAKGAEREVAKALKEAQREREKLKSNANRIASVSRLISWYSLGILTEEELRGALTDREYPATAIERYVAEAKEKKAKRDAGSGGAEVAQSNGEPGVS